MDIATILGLLLGLGLVGGSIAMGGGVSGFINIPSMMIVVGGTLAATMVMFPLKTVLGSFKVAQHALRQNNTSPREIIDEIVALATKARKESIIALEKVPIENEFLRKGIRLVVDGTDPELLKSILRTEVSFMQQRHKVGQKVFKGMGTLAPAFGMIGTLIGLVQMLRTLNDPEKIGPSMAVALITTFYGALLANLVFNPIANKLEGRSNEETLIMELIIEGVLSILAGENPRIIKEKLLAFLPPRLRQEEESA
ncbi:MAG: motility protein A [Deltaproteobacteria bacterium]|nr:MAG: motility protein A [Deltaproteobacteria bacterium]